MLSDHPFPIFDGHNDTLMAFILNTHEQEMFLTRRDTGHIDLVRAAEGGLKACFFAIFIPPEQMLGKSLATPPRPGAFHVSPIDHDYAAHTAQKAIRTFDRLAAASGERLKKARTVNDLAAYPRTLCGALHLEGAEPIAPGLDNLEFFYDSGIRSIGIVWSRDNAFGHGVNFSFPGSPDCGPGLTGAGKALVRACNRKGIMMDLSHLNEKGFWDVAKLSTAPLVATHSCVHALCPSPRNLTDRQIDAIGSSGGMVGINFFTGFLRPDGRPDAQTPLSAVVEHIRYVTDRIGVDHVGLGSDFDGALIPDEMKDVAGLPRLTAAMARAGFLRQEIEKITYGNWIRVLKTTWKA